MPRDQTIENTATDSTNLLSPRFAPQNIEDRLAHLTDPHVRPLNEWVERIRQDPRLPPGAGHTIPWFDPRGGGVNARLLFLMQDPSEVATFTRFVSPDNNDPTAHNTTFACRTAGLDPAVRVHWNVFPWWVNVVKGGRPVDPARPPQTYSSARPLARKLLREVIDLLPHLVTIVLLGKEAQQGYKSMQVTSDSSRGKVRVFCCPSCSPQSWNNVDKKDPRLRRRSEIVIDTLREAARTLTP